MRLKVFVTDVGEEGAPPTLFVPENELDQPSHPQGMVWRLIKTITDKESPFVDHGLIGLVAIELHGYFLTFGTGQRTDP